MGIGVPYSSECGTAEWKLLIKGEHEKIYIRY